MPNHFTTLGFEVVTQEDLKALAQQAASHARAVHMKAHHYLRWVGSAGEELWLQIDETGDLIGMNPHFSGGSSVRVRLQSRVGRDNDTALDGAFIGWADPREDMPESGMYPIVFDAPDAATYSDLKLPAIVEVQIAAFAHEISSYNMPESYIASQQRQRVKFASQSFIPSGLFGPDGSSTEPPESMAIFTGHIIDAEVRANSLTGRPFFWALVNTLGGTYDVIIDRNLLTQTPSAGGVLSGSFWLSGRIIPQAQLKGIASERSSEEPDK